MKIIRLRAEEPVCSYKHLTVLNFVIAYSITSLSLSTSIYRQCII